MPSSGSVDFSVNRNEIVYDAFTEIGHLAAGETLSAADLDWGCRKLNMLVKSWQGNSDFAPGLKEWSRKTAYLFLAKNTTTYALGPTGSHWTASFSSTTISANEALGQTILSVTSTTGMTAADNIGIVQNDGTIHWTTISSTGAGPTVIVASALTAAASAGNKVYWYTTKARRPLELLTAILRDVDGKDSPVSFMTRQRYEAMPDKAVAGSPNRIAYEAQIPDGMLYTDAYDITKVLRIVYLSPIEDFDSPLDTPDYPQEWNRPLVTGLAIDLAPGCGIPVSVDLKENFARALSIAQNANPENCDLCFEPDR